eukprot:4410546-Amphidinium_carterae.1
MAGHRWRTPSGSSCCPGAVICAPVLSPGCVSAVAFSCRCSAEEAGIPAGRQAGQEKGKSKSLACLRRFKGVPNLPDGTPICFAYNLGTCP